MNTKKLLSAILTALLAMSPVVMAVDLGNYPSFLFTDNNLDAYVVVGSAAAPADVVGAVDLAARLAGESYEEVSTGDTVTVSGGESENIPINGALAASGYLDQVMDDSDLAGLMDSEVNFQGDSYNFREILAFGSSQPSIQSSLTSSDDDYESGVYMETTSGSMYYYWVFDESINVSEATSDQPFEMDFLGKNVRITSVTTTGSNAGAKFTAYVGDEYWLNVGDSVESEGKTVTLDNVGSSSVVVNVDGTTKVISSGSTQTVNEIEITVDSVFYREQIDQSSANLVIGKTAQATYTDGDKYLKDDNICNNDPEDTDCWEWVISGLTGNSATTVASTGPTGGPYIGVKGVFTINDDTDDPITAGGCYQFPNDYAEVCFDSLTVADSDYMTLTVEYADSVDLSNAISGKTAQNVIYIHTSEEEGLNLEYDVINGLSADVRTRQVWLEVNGTVDLTNVYYRDSDGSKTYAGYVNSTGGDFAQVNYGDTKETNVELNLTGNVSVADDLNLTFDILGKTTTDLADGYDDLKVQLSHSASAFDGIGGTASTEEADELQWCSGTGTCSWKNIGTKDENHRTIYGIIVEDPKSHGASDEVVFSIPNEQVFAKVVVKGPSTTVTSGSDGSVKQVVPVTNAVAKLDTEVSPPVGKNLVLVGGPAVNRLTAQAMGLEYPTYGGSGLLPFTEGEGYIELTDGVLESGKYAVVVAGWEATDTRNACSVMQQFESFSEQLDGNMAVKITSVSASGITAA